jgi:hypothetical protein
MRRLLVVLLCLLWMPVALAAALQPESAVVKITAKEGERSKTGTGFIVALSPEIVYIVTASHVVEGDAEPQVEFFTRRDRPVKATVKEAEVNDPKGLALLTVRGKDAIAKNLSALDLDAAAPLKGGDEVTAIGFPRMGGDWAVSKGHLSARQGRELIFAMPVGEGNSGGPLLKDGKVVALVTSEAQGRAFAAAAASVKLFLEGTGIDLIPAGESEAAATEPPRPSKEKETPAGPTEKPVTIVEPPRQSDLPAAAVALLEGKSGTARTQAIGQIAALLPEALTAEQGAWVLHGATEGDRANAIYALAAPKKLKAEMSADGTLKLLAGTSGAQRTAAIGYLTPLLAGNLTGAQLSAMLETTKETDRFNALYAIGRNKKIKSGLSAAEAESVLQHAAAGIRTQMIGELIPYLAGAHGGGDLGKLLGNNAGVDRYNAIYALGRNKKVKEQLAAAESLVALKDLAASQRTSAIGELIPYLVANLSGKDVNALLHGTQDTDRYNAIYALARNKKIKNGLVFADAELILDGASAGARTGSIGEIAALLQPNLKGVELGKILGATQDQDRFNALHALISARKVAGGMNGEELKPVLVGMQAQARDAALAQLLAIK